VSGSGREKARLLFLGRSLYEGAVPETIVGEVVRVTYENEATGFRVVSLGHVSGLGSTKSIALVGVMPALGPGTKVRAQGELEVHARHGQRLKVESVFPLEPESLPEIEKFLGSGVLPGVKEKTAQKIVRYFGLETLRVLDQDSARLGEVPGLGGAKVQGIRSAWATHRQETNLRLALQSFGVGPGVVRRIIRTYGERAFEVVTQHPYRLGREVSGIGFKTADAMARAQGLSPLHPERLEAGLLHLLDQEAENGHTWTERTALIELAMALLGVESSLLGPALDSLALRGDVRIPPSGEVQPRALAEAEDSIASDLARLLGHLAKKPGGLEARITEFEGARGITLESLQRKAVELALGEKLLVVTGGPGVGKTTLIQAIVTVGESLGQTILLAAPTGRAARRLEEAAKKSAQTVHRLLEVDGRTGVFQRHRENPLEVDLLILDESSMIDVYLMADLLEAVPDKARVVFVGDVDQLPSVGPGAALGDFIRSKAIPTVRLTAVFRQAQESGIVVNSHRILHGELPVGDKHTDGDFFVISAKDPARARELVLELMGSRIPSRFGFDPLREVQVLTPMHRGEAGTQALNQALQAKLNPDGQRFDDSDGALRVGDKVIQTKNDLERHVVNGDMGEVIRIDPAQKKVSVAFEDAGGLRQVDYEREQLKELRLAYAASVHKSQGSEYPAVIVVLLKSHFVMLSRNLLYTAVTRAKKLCVLVTDDRALRIALSETRKEERRTRLVSGIQAALATGGA
jgi:exodeoxyribonuclease V alpha subunit